MIQRITVPKQQASQFVPVGYIKPSSPNPAMPASMSNTMSCASSIESLSRGTWTIAEFKDMHVENLVPRGDIPASRPHTFLDYIAKYIPIIIVKSRTGAYQKSARVSLHT